MKFKTYLIFVLLYCLPNYLWAQGDTLLFIGHGHPPWHFESEKGELVGINVDITKIICQRLNIPCKLRFMPFARSWETIKSGKADAIMSASRKEVRIPYLYYPKEDIRISQFVFFVHKEEKIDSFTGTYEEIKNNKKRIGIQIGASYDKEFWRQFPYKDGTSSYNTNKRDYNSLISPVPHPIQNFKKLSMKRVDVFPFDRDVGLYQLKELKLQNIISHYPQVLFSKGYPISFAKKSDYPNIKEVGERFEQELILLKQSGEYQKIVNHWLQ